MDPYADQRNAQDRRVRQLLYDFGGNLDEGSPIEAIAFMDIILVYSQYDAFNIRNMFVLSSYQRTALCCISASTSISPCYVIM